LERNSSSGAGRSDARCVLVVLNKQLQTPDERVAKQGEGRKCYNFTVNM